MTDQSHGDSFPSTRVIEIRMFILTFIIAIALSSFPRTAFAYQVDLSLMPISFPAQTSEVVAYFNQIARPDDIITFPFQFAPLLSQVTAGQRLVGFASWQEAENELPNLAGQVDMVMYNPEHWENTPVAEQADLEATILRASDLAHGQGLKFVFAPDRQFAEEYLGSAASQADIVLLQGQRIQDDTATFTAWISDMVRTARTANPAIKIFVQVGATRGSAQQMYGAIESVAGEIDGVAVWSMPRTLDVLQEFVNILRKPAVSITPTLDTNPSSTQAFPVTVTPRLPVIETAAPTAQASSTLAGQVQLAMGTRVPTSVASIVATPLPSPPAASAASYLEVRTTDSSLDLFLAAGALLVGLVLGILLGMWLARRTVEHSHR